MSSNGSGVKRKLDETETAIDSKRLKHEDITTPSLAVEESKTVMGKCFHNVKARLYLSIAPIYVKEPSRGIIKQHLDPLLMTYDPRLKGVVLAHSNVEFDSDKAKVMYDSPFAFIWITANFLVWRPQSGDRVQGYINMQSPSHIGLLIHDTFNATIKKDMMPADWTFVANQEDENDENNNDNTALTGDSGTDATTSGAGASVASGIGGGSMGFWMDGQGKRIDGALDFMIKNVHVSARMVSVQGTLLNGGVREDLTEMTQSSRGSGKWNASKSSGQENPADNTTASPAKQRKHITFD